MKETKKNDNNNEDKSPQRALEKILQAEIEVAGKIAAAKKHAEKRIEAAQEEIVSLKNNIIAQARRDREETLKNGIAIAKEDAKQRIEQARIESEKFKKSGEKFDKEAVQEIETVILGEFDRGNDDS